MTFGSLTELISSLQICPTNYTEQGKLCGHVLPRQRIDQGVLLPLEHGTGTLFAHAASMDIQPGHRLGWCRTTIFPSPLLQPNLENFYKKMIFS